MNYEITDDYRDEVYAPDYNFAHEVEAEREARYERDQYRKTIEPLIAIDGQLDGEINPKWIEINEDAATLSVGNFVVTIHDLKSDLVCLSPLTSDGDIERQFGAILETEYACIFLAGHIKTLEK
jgi:hypothetical protein